LKLATWNVNSLAVRLPQLLSWLESHPVDAIVLQETKLVDERFPHAAIEAAGYTAQCFGQKTYNGVALLTRGAASDVVRNIPGFDDAQTRVITGHYGGLRVIGAYFPNGEAPGSDKFAYKLRWIEALREWLRSELAAHPELVLMGDFNIAPEDRDVHDPLGRADPVHRRGARALSRTPRARPRRRVPPLRAAAKDLELVGLPQPGVPQEPGSAHRPHPGQRCVEAQRAGLHHRQAAAQESAPERPRAGARDARALNARVRDATSACPSSAAIACPA